MFKVLACDPSFGNTLDEDLNLLIKGSGKKTFIKFFQTFEEAEQFCIEQIERSSGIDYIVFENEDDTGTVISSEYLVRKNT